ncbi:hypothetical protein RGU70_00035 [Herbaspirillum sp. RTI4]|uniref:hypothetical protein n=1 Tax=Herbaspirillum sp. RTI4 TaxID=3048640 RepID=UPI002AB501DC|nr:hypothetical protein [Herbaspirillum sp. RTI4]MDY7576715.1 hypothetical protein [Herbaspirillum sp. RTI4]MEA9983571.1 hypothetical protein [Herbaspirillum sp. RTI4]
MQCREPVIVQAFVPESTIKAFDVSEQEKCGVVVLDQIHNALNEVRRTLLFGAGSKVTYNLSYVKLVPVLIESKHEEIGSSSLKKNSA